MPLFRNGANAMERVREDLLTRAHSQRQQRQQEEDLEQGLAQQLPTDSAMMEQRQNAPAVPTLFGEIPRDNYGRDDRVPPTAEEVESPKSPDFQNGARASRFTLPSISRIWSRAPSAREQDEEAVHPAMRSQSQMPSSSTEHLNWTMPLPPEPATLSRSTIRPVSSEYPATYVTDTPETRSSPEERRRRRQRRRQRGERARDGRRKRRGKPPQRFLGCFPMIKSRRMRAYIVRCFVSGLFLVILLTVYLALSVSNQISMGEFTIVLILIVILATLFFCYGLIKLCMLVMRRDKAREHRSADSMDGHGYAIPNQPIQVTLARDEEAVGVESETSKMTPPAYGIWRESVRVDPDRIYWQRNENASVDDVRPETRASRRPPSYISDDGISYVVDAAPRSTVSPPSSVSQPLPVHPSEYGRVNEYQTAEGRSDWGMYR